MGPHESVQLASGRASRAQRSTSPHLVSTIALVFGSLIWPSLLTQWIGPVAGQCRDKAMTSFERIGGVTIKDADLKILYQANVSQATIGHHHHHNQHANTTTTTLYQIPTPITAECNNRCRRTKDCRGFLVDYSRHTCWSVNHPSQSMSTSSLVTGGGSTSGLAASNFVLDRSPAPVHLELTSERTAYFEKVCLDVPITECERAWIFERVLSYHIHGQDDKVIDDVPSRLKCQEHCYNEQRFKCRSGEYDYLTMQCRLSRVDRHMKPLLFRPTTSNVDYFENQCVPVGQQCDAFERFEDLDLGRGEIMRSMNSSEECQLYCTQTIKAFVCRSFTWSPMTQRCYLNSANTFTVGGLDKLLPAPGMVYYQRNDCIDLKLECDTTSMTLNLRTPEPFRGRMYVRDGDPQVCAHTLGRSALSSSLSIPFHSPMGRCATRELPSRFSSVVVIQQHQLIQRRSDRYIKLVCDFQTANKTISSSYNVIANPWASTALINTTELAPRILLRITDRHGNDVAGAKLGDELQLRIEAEKDSPYDMMARSVLAKSGSSDAESIVLIDRDGCPTDFRIFPRLRKLDKRTIIGRFDAFKFSSDAVVRFQVDVQFCLNACPQITCQDPQQALFNMNPQQLDDGSEAQGANPATASPAGATSSPTTSATAASGHNGAEATQSGAHEYTRSAISTTYRPLASGNSDYLSSNSLLEPYGGQQLDNSMLNTRRAQPPVNQPLAGDGQQLTPSGSNQPPPASDQLFDQQAKEMSRSALGIGQHHRNQQLLNNNNNIHHQHHQKLAHSSQHKQTYDKIRPNSADHLTNLMDQSTDSDEMSAAGQQQQDQNSHRRRRRSAEPLPASPKHVPLQREIIIFERAATTTEGEGDESKPSQTGATRASAGQAKSARGQTEARATSAANAKSSARRNHKANKDQGEFFAEFSWSWSM